MGVHRQSFGCLADGNEVPIITLTNGNGMQADIITYGGTLVRLTAPDREGCYQDVVLGYDTLKDYVAGDKFFGALIGRYANRIANGSYQRKNHIYQLTKNEQNRATLHGGNGFDCRLWSIEEIEEGESLP